MIIPVIMAGGVGSRLWPLSRESYPKQFISFEAGGSSLFQESLQRLSGLEGVGKPIVVCNQEHRFLVAEQLRQIGIDEAVIVLEPVGRNTAPAVTLAALEANKRGENPNLLVLAADHSIPDVSSFHTALNKARLQAESACLVTFGIVPQGPETGYGYIRRGDAMGEVFSVDGFAEKPDKSTAESYLATGRYYWNSGMFMFSAETYLKELALFAPEILKVCKRAHSACADDLDFKRIPEDIFATCPSDSIDYAVMEHTKAAVVVPLDAGWNDLGAWEALWEQAKQDENGNVLRGDVIASQVSNTLVHSESRLVSVIGIDDAVIVETADAVLVSTKSKAQDVKEIVGRLKALKRSEADTHTLIHRPWGSYESLAEADGFQVKRIIVKSHASLSLQSHQHRAEHWIVVQGIAQVTCGEKVFPLKTNESTYIPVGAKHRLKNQSEDIVVLIEVQSGSYLGEDDIVRFEDIYGR